MGKDDYLKRRILPLLLALVLSLTACIPAFAASNKVKHYDTVTVLGDSIAAGFSLPDYVKKSGNGENLVSKQRIEGSYAAIVADAVGAEKLNMLAQPGFRTEEVHMMLDPSYTSDRAKNNQLGQQARIVGGAKNAPDYSEESLAKQRDEYRNAVKSSDLVILDIGANDAMMSAMGAARNLVSFGSAGENPLETFWNSVNEEGLSEAVSDASKDLQTVVQTPRLLKALKTAIYGATSDYVEHYNAIVRLIYELNPNTTVVAVGNYNPFHQWKTISGDTVGSYLQPYYDYLNNTKKTAVADHKGHYYYVDVSDTPLITDSLGTLIKNGKFDAHPTEEGHRYMASQILAALSED